MGPAKSNQAGRELIDMLSAIGLVATTGRGHGDMGRRTCRASTRTEHIIMSESVYSLSHTSSFPDACHEFDHSPITLSFKAPAQAITPVHTCNADCHTGPQFQWKQDHAARYVDALIALEEEVMAVQQAVEQGTHPDAINHFVHDIISRAAGSASGSGQQDQGQGQAVKKVIAERRQVIKAALRGLVEAAQPDLSPAEVDAVVAEVNKRMTMGSKQCVLAAVLCLSVLLQSFLGQPTRGFPAAAGPAPGPPPPLDPAHPPYAHPRIATRSSPRTAAAPAQLPPPVQLGIWDPQLLAQIKDAMELLTKASVLEHLMRGPHHLGIRLLPGEVAAFEQPSSAWPVAMLQQLDEEHLTGDGNSLNANATKVITSIQEFYRHPGRFIGLWCKAVGVVEEGFSRTMKKHFPQLVLGRLDYSLPDRQHKWRLPPNSVLRQPRWREEVAKHRRLLGLPATWREGQDSIGKGGAGRLPSEKRVRYALFVNRSLEGWQTPHDTCPRPFTMLPMVGVRARHFVIDDRVLHGVLTDLGMTTLTRSQFEADSLPHWQKFIQYSQLQNSGWEFARRVETDGVSISVHFVRSQEVTEPVELPFIGRKLTATSDYDPTTHIAVGVNPGVTQAIKAGHAQWHQVTGQVLRQWEWELSKGQLKHDSGLTKAKQDTARWSAAIQPQLQQLAAATPAGTTLGGLHAHVMALKATWDALWEEYLKPRWRRQRLALHHAQERVIEAFCKKVVNGMKWVSRHYYHTERGVAVFLGAGNFSQGGWKAGAVRAGFRKVVEQPSRPSADPRPDRLVIVDEFRTSRLLELKGIIPAAWKVARISPLFKNTDPTDPNKYRMLAVSSVLYHLYANVLRHVLTAWCMAHKVLPAEQFGFIPGRSTMQPMFIVRHLVHAQKANADVKHRKLFTAFIDFKHAYDHIPRQQLWEHLRVGVKLPQPLLACLEGLYRDDSYVLIDGPHRTPPVTPDQGVKQGCPISPLLFALYVHDISKEFLGPVDVVRVQGTPVTHFMYADDLTLTAAPSIGYKHEILPVVREFKYLGMHFNPSATPAFAATHMRAGMFIAMRQAYKRAREYGVLHDPFALCHLIRAFVLPLGLYGSQVWGTAFLGHGVQLSNPVQTRKLSFLRFAARVLYNQLQRRHPMLMPVFEDPSNQALLAKLQELGNTNLRGDANTIGAHSMQLAVAMQQHYSNPGK
ncbi:hypothetical protein QJQ45_005104 [Haematococcus lacustris]|nr:hypothetical protein QJQ45_005104 [Haematococcus lacustris]